MSRSGALLAAAFATVLASVASTSARAQSQAAGAAPQRPEISAALAALLAPGEADKPSVTEQQRDYLLSLPAHTLDTVERAVDVGQITSALHLGRILSLSLAPAAVDMVMQDNCFLCHTDPESHTGPTLMGDPAAPPQAEAHMNLGRYVADVHFRRGIGCAGCHGGDATEPMGHDFPASWPEDGDMRHRDRSWIPEFCARCHSDTSYMRRFNPGLPTDQLDKYKTSRHGQLLLEAKDSRAAQCTSCHGVHGIQSASSPLSTVYPKRLPETCAHCHADPKVMAGFTLADGRPLPTKQYEQYRASVHGRALLERGDLGAPACNDCHGNHAAMPPEVTSIAQVCRTCHSQNGTLFDGSRHKKVFEQHGWPECGSCHGEHTIAETSDAMMAPGPESVCNGCHARFAQHNPECNATAKYFHTEIVGLQAAHDELTGNMELFARRGLDTDAMRDELDNLLDSLKQTRSYVHSFEGSEFAAAAAPAHASIEAIARSMASARDELRYRFRGLIVAGLFIAASIALLWLRTRRAERDRGM